MLLNLKRMYIKQIIFTLIFLTIGFGSKAQDEPFTGSVLWKVSGNGLSKSSYIFGTNHVLSRSFLDRISALDSILDSCKQVVGEIDMNNESFDMDAIRKASIIPDGKTYSQLLDKQEYHQLDSALQVNLNIRLSQLETISPVTILTMYTINLYNRVTDQSSNTENMDTHFQEYARSRGKKVIALETMDQQIQYLFYSKPLQDQIKELLCNIFSGDVEQDIETLDQYYQAGDLIGLEKIMNEEDDCSSSKNDKEILYKNRNEDWMKKLPKIIQDQPSFIAVGCLHLVGVDGLLYQLSKMGYQIKAVAM